MNTYGLLRGCNGDSPPRSQHRTTGMPNKPARAAAALIRRGNILADLYALREGFVLYVLGPSVGNSGKKIMARATSGASDVLVPLVPPGR